MNGKKSHPRWYLATLFRNFEIIRKFNTAEQQRKHVKCLFELSFSKNLLQSFTDSACFSQHKQSILSCFEMVSK